MSFLDAMNEAEEPDEIFYTDDPDRVWKTGISETTVQELAEDLPQVIYFKSTEKEVFD